MGRSLFKFFPERLCHKQATPRETQLMANGDFGWFARQVRVRDEIAVAAHWQGRGHKVFLPLYSTQRC